MTAAVTVTMTMTVTMAMAMAIGFVMRTRIDGYESTTSRRRLRRLTVCWSMRLVMS